MAKEYWRQKLNFGKDVYDPEHEQPELSLPADDPPDKKISKRGGRKSPPLFSSLHFSSSPQPSALSSQPVESDQQWLARLTAAWPGIDIPAQLAKAHKKRKGDVERGWFETSWLPSVTQLAPAPGAFAPTVTIEAEPDAWRQHLKDHHESESWADSAASYPWTSLPAEWRAKIVREMKQRRAA